MSSANARPQRLQATGRGQRATSAYSDTGEANAKNRVPEVPASLVSITASVTWAEAGVAIALATTQQLPDSGRSPAATTAKSVGGDLIATKFASTRKEPSALITEFASEERPVMAAVIALKTTLKDTGQVGPVRPV